MARVLYHWITIIINCPTMFIHWVVDLRGEKWLSPIRKYIDGGVSCGQLFWKQRKNIDEQQRAHKNQQMLTGKNATKHRMQSEVTVREIILWTGDMGHFKATFTSRRNGNTTHILGYQGQCDNCGAVLELSQSVAVILHRLLNFIPLIVWALNSQQKIIIKFRWISPSEILCFKNISEILKWELSENAPSSNDDGW